MPPTGLQGINRSDRVQNVEWEHELPVNSLLLQFELRRFIPERDNLAGVRERAGVDLRYAQPT